MHALAIFTALNVPDPPELMSFDEPENYVHPRVLQVLAEEFKEASNLGQILITTHSPYFIDDFELEDLVIVEKEKGSTRTRRASSIRGVKQLLGGMELGDAWYTGSFDGVP